MGNPTGEIIEEALQALIEDQNFLPELVDKERERAFRSLDAILSTPNQIHKAFLRIPLENDEVVRIPAYRIQHNNISGPYKGGIRFNEHVNEEEVSNLAALMTLKNSLHSIPFGGGKGGVGINPREFTTKELLQICRKYVRYFCDSLGPDKDIPAPDMGTGEREMDWMMAEYKSIHPSQPYLGSFTGKSVANGGSLGRREATGKGVYFTFRYLLHDFIQSNRTQLANEGNIFAKTALSLFDQPLKVAIQGFGNVGSVAALEAYRCKNLNNKVVAVSDRNVTLYNKNGLDIPTLVEFANQNSGELPKTQVEVKIAEITADVLHHEYILTLDVDVLFLAALEGQIKKDNVTDVKAKVIVEGANAPVTNYADQYLSEKGIIITPDILANAGGVIVSYFEWLQDRETQFYSEEEIFSRLYTKMKETMDSVFPQYFGDPHPLRRNCYIHAVMRLSTQLYKQGKLY